MQLRLDGNWVVAAIALTASSCAPTVSGQPFAPAETVEINTAPIGATARTEYGDSCITPCLLPLLRSRGGEIYIDLAGYQGETISIAAYERNNQPAPALRSTPSGHRHDAADVAFEAIRAVVAGQGRYRQLDTGQIWLRLVPLPDYSAGDRTTAATERGEGTVYRLSAEEIAAIRGAAVPEAGNR